MYLFFLPSAFYVLMLVLVLYKHVLSYLCNACNFVCLSVICKWLYAFCHNMFCLLFYMSVKSSTCYMFVNTPTLNKTFILYTLL